MARIVLTALGSLGDLHPFIAIAAELKVLGHDPWLATHATYRTRVESEDIRFAPIRPDFPDYGADIADVMRRAMDVRTGSEYVVRRLILPFVRETASDLLEISRGAELIVGHTLAFTAPLVAESLGIPFVQTALQPFVMYSAWDPPVITLRPGNRRWPPRLSPGAWRVLWRMARPATARWFREVHALRRSLGLPSRTGHPMFDGWSGVLNLALFSPVLAAPQPDWPPHTVAAGFPVHDRDEPGRDASDALAAFLEAGPPPIVFTLGSAAVWDPDRFYEDAVRASLALGQRAVLLTGPEPRGVPANLPPAILAVEYAPHSSLFPAARVNVHQGGIGTTGQALRAGRPMLVVPFSHDQPDNAWRCRALGVARVLRRQDLGAAALERELRALIADDALEARAREVGARVRAEHGARTAAAAIDAQLRAARPMPST